MQYPEILTAVLDRAEALAKRANLPFDRVGLALDLGMCQSHVPLRWAALLEADDFNFTHDVFGIHKHMNRDTCRLDNCFLPRFARLTGQAA
jgi:hypothetical protein